MPIYLLVRGVVGFAQAMSVEQSYAFARLLAAILHRVDRRHRAIGVDNLRQAFGDQYTPAEREAIVRRVYLHFCMMLMEILHIPRKLHPTTWRDRITLVGHERVLDRLLQGGPLIMLTGHFGNWEMAGYLFGVFGFPPNSVARTLDNPYLDAYLRTFRERTGQKMIPKKGGYDQMLEVLRTGGVLSFLADQDAGERGMFVDFFGRPASTHKAIAILALEHQAPVVVGYARRIGPGFRYEVGCTELIEPSELTGTAARRADPHPALHHRPRNDHPPRPRPVPLAPPPLEAPAEAEESQTRPRRLTGRQRPAAGPRLR